MIRHGKFTQGEIMITNDDDDDDDDDNMILITNTAIKIIENIYRNYLIFCIRWM